MDSRELTFLIGFLILGIVPVFAKHLAAGAAELIMLLGMIISMSAAFSKSS
ncbi:MAG TPA: hypothetical protein PK175_09870 [Syntrophales bacterium]|mgnify:CR=1 FL=1|jgi:hypothetical protein|nr:hypothetical protein [Syntrophales bacterium]HPC33882.1 hypothetical protein [Syntrophales bacterium]HQG35167.1 hypothetical protein [Syntrophales bacterium]HQI36752.1 hypothetical protein [Syntrophales bacterium]HQJ31218.1 hypothetical protein [Syntrophales bacterium]